MLGFEDKLVVTPLADGRRWQVVEPFDYHDATGLVIEIPAGFVTDFASIPQVFWNVLPPWGRYGKATVIHDWLYRYHRGTRAEADAILLAAMTLLHVPRWQRWVIYSAVRVCGWYAWNHEPRGGK